jgi:tetratricopeptide (TPR) repeat protein
MRQGRGRAALWSIALAVGFDLAAASSASAALTEGRRLAAIYDTILHAKFDDARAQMAAACPPAPLEACRALEVVALWWEIQLDPNNRRLDARLEETAAAAIRASEQWTRREPGRAEAWFYLAGARAPLVQWRVLRGQRLAAARDGKQIKEALERSLTLDPELHDAYFGIGLYHYYADVAPAAMKALRWLLLLPGGDRAEGLREMLIARDDGELLRGEADYQLHWLYLWYEQKPDAALSLLRSLDRQYPSNPVFLQRIAEVQHEYFHDHRASAASWEALIARAGVTAMRFPRIALAHFALGSEYAHLGERDRAIAALKSAIALAPRVDADDVRGQADALLKKF